MDAVNITENGIFKLMQSLKIPKAAGPDKMSARILKQLATTVAPMLTTIFRCYVQKTRRAQKPVELSSTHPFMYEKPSLCKIAFIVLS